MTQSPRREYPHIVSKGMRRNERRLVVVSNGPVDGYGTSPDCVFVGEGYAKSDGSPTDAGRAAILARICAHAPKSKARYCVVWNKTSCTWIDETGAPRDGRSPPTSDIMHPSVYATTHMLMERVDFIRLPEGSDPPCLCIRRIDRDLVEVSPGEEIALAYYDDPLPTERPDPMAALFDDEGNIRLPDIYRGQRVTGTRHDMVITGPVQPYEDGVILRNPWPDDLRKACEQVAGRRLTPAMAETAWRIIHPADPGVIRGGVREAA